MSPANQKEKELIAAAPRAKVLWFENPLTPARSGVWRYNLALRHELEKDPRVEIGLAAQVRESPTVLDLAVSSRPGRPRLSDQFPAPLRPLVRMAGRAGLANLYFFRPMPLPPVEENQILHFTDQYLATRLTFMKNRLLIITVHDIIPFISERYLGVNLYEQQSHRFVYWAAIQNLRKAAAVITVSEFTRETLVQNTRIPAEKVHAIHSAVDHRKFHPGAVPDEFWVRHELSRSRPLILHVSNEAPHKNLPSLLRAIAIVKQSIPNVLLVKLGQAHNSDQRRAHLALIAQLGIQNHVRFLDDVDDEDIVNAYRTASILAMPSVAEGFGLPVLEAMACGTPVISSDSWSLPEVIGQAGILLDPLDEGAWADEMIRVLQDPALAESLSKRGKERAASFTWRRTAQETIDVYLSVLTQGK